MIEQPVPNPCKGPVSHAVAALGPSELTSESIRDHLWPLFTRTLTAFRATGEAYFANHSLGRPLDQTAEDLKQGLDLWYQNMDGAYAAPGGWLETFELFRSNIATIVGLDNGHLVAPKNSQGQALRAVLNSFPTDRPLRVVSTRSEFDSADAILKAYAEMGRVEVKWIQPTGESQGLPFFKLDALLGDIEDGLDLFVSSHVFFETGQVLQGLPDISSKVHAAGGLFALDVYHSAGCVPFSVIDSDVDFAMGGCYKYLLGGPGAGFLALHPRIAESERKTLDTGWFAKPDPFAFKKSPGDARGPLADGWLESTPPALVAYQAKSGPQFVADVGVRRLRLHNLQQQEFLKHILAIRNIPTWEPKEVSERGAFLVAPHPDAKAIATAMRNSGVNVDARGSSLRFGPNILNPESELEQAALACAEAIKIISAE